MTMTILALCFTAYTTAAVLGCVVVAILEIGCARQGRGEED